MAVVPLVRQDDASFLLTFRKKESGAIQDLTGMRVWFTAKTTIPSSPTADLDDATAVPSLKYYWDHNGSVVAASVGLSLPSGGSAVDGVLRIDFLHADTTTLSTTARLNYDIQVMYPPDGNSYRRVETWDKGIISVDPDLTRRLTVP
jgi:hypothetical protein